MENEVGSFVSPGPGFFPFWSAVVLGVLAILLAVTSFFKKEDDGIRIQWKGVKWVNVILVVASLLMYSILLNTLGYVITTLGLMLLLFALTGRPKMWSWVGSALLSALLSFLVFYSLLNVQLPRGKLGF
jgi:putative tricarboxylic transport membrane protein